RTCHRPQRARGLVRPHLHATVLAIELADLKRTDLARRTAVRLAVRIELWFDWLRQERRREPTWHITAHVHPEVSRILSERSAEVSRCLLRRPGRRARCGGAARPGHLDAGAAVLVVEPELAALRDDDGSAVGRPHWREVVLSLGSR